MTFKEWWANQPPKRVAEMYAHDARAVWEAATKAEREACKRDCREVRQAHAGLVDPYHVVAGECIAAIDERSNG